MSPTQQSPAAEIRVAGDAQPTYTVSTWDHEREEWEPRDRQASKWELRTWLRRLYAESWDHISILIQRNDW